MVKCQAVCMWEGEGKSVRGICAKWGVVGAGVRAGGKLKRGEMDKQGRRASWTERRGA